MLISWEDCVRKYPEIGTSFKLDQKEVDNYHVPYAIAELESRLSAVFATPFDTTNMTAKDLAVDLLYVRLGLGKTDKAELVREHVDKLIEALLSGAASMVYEDGTTVATVRLPGTTHEGYSQTFTLGDVRDMHISEALLADEEDRRN